MGLVVCVRVCLDADNSWAGVEKGSVLRYGKCLSSLSAHDAVSTFLCAVLISSGSFLFIVVQHGDGVMRKKVVLRNGDSARRIHSVYTKEFFLAYIYSCFTRVSWFCRIVFLSVGVKASVLLRDFMVLLEHAWGWLRRMLMKFSLQFLFSCDLFMSLSLRFFVGIFKLRVASLVMPVPQNLNVAWFSVCPNFFFSSFCLTF